MTTFLVVIYGLSTIGVGFWLRGATSKPKDYVMRFHSPPYDWAKDGL